MIFLKTVVIAYLLQQLKIRLRHSLSRWAQDCPTHFLKSLHFGSGIHSCSCIPPTQERAGEAFPDLPQLCQRTTHWKIGSYLEVSVNNQTTNSSITTSPPQTHKHLAFHPCLPSFRTVPGAGVRVPLGQSLSLCVGESNLSFPFNQVYIYANPPPA